MYIVDEEPDEEEGYKLFHHKAHLENFSAFKVLTENYMWLYSF